MIDCSVTVNGKNYNVTIDSAATTGRLSLPYGSDLSTLKVATIEVSNKAKTSLSEGNIIDVNNNSFTIAVTAENGNVNNYTIVIIVGSNNKANIKTFTFQKDINPQLNADVVATITKDTIRATFPFGTDPNLIPTFTLSVGTNAKVKNLCRYDS